MSLNENLKTRRTQLAILASLIVVGAATAGGVMWYGNHQEGDIRLRGEKGAVTINPDNVRAQQHLDYAWAVTGYGAQGTSTDYVISLEGTEEGRKALATRRAFYISASRAKEHVQIYTDGKADWRKAVTSPEREIKTAHDALQPETQRQQAKAIWAMGQPVSKTAIGRAWVRHQGMQDTALTAKIIPATRRFPEPALALPVYDNNGKSAGLALVSLVSSPEGRLTQGDTRMVMTERARGAVLQRSQSGHTLVVSDLSAALEAVKANPKDGVVWQTGAESPSSHLLKVTGGERQDDKERLSLTRLTIPEELQRESELKQAEQVREQEAQRKLAGSSLSIVLPAEEVVTLRPEELNPVKTEPMTPASSLLENIRNSDRPDGREQMVAAQIRSENTPQDKSTNEQERASRVVSDLAAQERDIVRHTDNSERGRMPERDEQTLTHTIQKER